jgi:protein SCO1
MQSSSRWSASPGHSGARLFFVFVVVVACLTGLSLVRARHENVPPGGHAVMATAATAMPEAADVVPSDPAADILPVPVVAARLNLTDQDGKPFALSTLPPGVTAVFFGYTHCTDICPDTVGRLELAMADYGPGVNAVFVTVDPERDDVAALRDYTRYLAKGFSALTGTADQIRTAATDWGVQYAKQETDADGNYEMSHTTDVYIVDATGVMRARIPYGTAPATIADVMRLVSAAGAATRTAGPTSAQESTRAASALELDTDVVSTSLWAGRDIPVILSIRGPAGQLDDQAATVSVQLATADGEAVGAPVRATPIEPPGITDISWLAGMDIPVAGAYRFDVTAQSGAQPLRGSTALLTALDGGSTPRLGAAVPTIATATLVDTDGDLLSLSTDPTADRRLYQTSTASALASHQPFVLVLDSTRFRTTSACGKALVMIKYLLDRWPDVTFIHHEPFRYDVELDTPVLQGDLSDPVLTNVATAWGLGSGPWDSTSMPWIFVVDGNGMLRAKYQGVVGSEDVDVMLTLLEAGG